MIHKVTLITCFLSKRISGCFGEELPLAISACLFIFGSSAQSLHVLPGKSPIWKKIRDVFLKRIHFRVEKKKKSGNIQYLIIKWGIRHET